MKFIKNKQMKKLTIGIVLFVLSSCGVGIGNYSEGTRILNIENIYNTDLCKYEVDYNRRYSFTLFSTTWNCVFIDSCGKYNVGDTVYINKK